MPSVYKKGSKIYISWYDPVIGKKRNKSTGLEVTDANLKKANSYAKQLEKRLGEEKDKLKTLQIRKGSIEAAFAHFLSNNADKHHKTIKDYKRFYNKFTETFSPADQCSVLNKLSVEDWINQIKRLPQQPNSIFGYYKQLNHFMNFLFEYSYVPMFKINRSVKPKPEIKEKITFTDNDIRTIINGSAEKNSNFRTAIYLLYYTGLRSSDILTITVERVDLERREISYFSPKRKKYRIVAFHEKLLPLLESRINEVGSGPLLSYKTIETLGKEVTKHISRLKLRDGYSARTFRKTFITICRRSGMDSSIVRELVGHEHQSTADRYYNKITTEVQLRELSKFIDPLDEEVPEKPNISKHFQGESILTEVQTEVHFEKSESKTDEIR